MQAVATAVTILQLVSLQIAKPLPGDLSRQIFLGQPGTRLTFCLQHKDKLFIAIDKQASKLISFKDDKGTDLTKAPKKSFSFGWLDEKRISKDGRTCAFEISGPTVPVKGAARIHLKAKVVIDCGSQEKTARQEGVALAKDSKITVGPMPIKISAVRDGGWSGAKMTVTFTASRSFARIKSLSFIGADGKVIKSAPAGSGHFGFMGKMTYEKSYGLHEKVEKATVEIEYFEKVEKFIVPIDVSTGVGL